MRLHSAGDCKRESSPRAAPQLGKMHPRMGRRGPSRVRPGQVADAMRVRAGVAPRVASGDRAASKGKPAGGCSFLQQGLTRLQAPAPETDARGLIAAFGRACDARPNSCVLLAPRTAALVCSSHRKALPPGGHFLRRFTARKRNCLRAAAPSEQLIKRSAHFF